MLGGYVMDETHQAVASEMQQAAYGQLSVELQQLSSVGPAFEPGLAGGLSSVKYKYRKESPHTSTCTPSNRFICYMQLRKQY